VPFADGSLLAFWLVTETKARKNTISTGSSFSPPQRRPARDIFCTTDVFVQKEHTNRPWGQCKVVCVRRVYELENNLHAFNSPLAKSVVDELFFSDNFKASIGSVKFSLLTRKQDLEKNFL
jgi:hypothetical protein